MTVSLARVSAVSPLSHKQLLRGTGRRIGRAIRAGKDTFPRHSTPIAWFYCCEIPLSPESGFLLSPAIGAIVTNSLVSW